MGSKTNNDLYQKLVHLEEMVKEMYPKVSQIWDWKNQLDGAEKGKVIDGNITQKDLLKLFSKVTLALIGMLGTAFAIIQIMINR